MKSNPVTLLCYVVFLIYGKRWEDECRKGNRKGRKKSGRKKKGKDTYGQREEKEREDTRSKEGRMEMLKEEEGEE